MASYEEKTYSFATDAYISEGWLGYVSLASEWWDKSRVDRGVCRMLLHHNPQLPTGEIMSAWFDAGVAPGQEGEPGMYRARVKIPTDTQVAYINDYLELARETTLMDSTSVGFMITRLELVEIGQSWSDDKFKAAWEMLEFSPVSVPADVLVGVERSGLLRAVDEAPADGGYIRLTRGGGGLGYVHRDIANEARAQADIARRIMGGTEIKSEVAVT